MKHFTLVVGSVALLLAACGNNDPPGEALVGNWVWDEDEEHGTMYLSFLDDGRYFWGAMGGDAQFNGGKYEDSGDSIMLHRERRFVQTQQGQESNLLISEGEYPSWVETGQYIRENAHEDMVVLRFAHEGDDLILTFVGDEDFPMRHRRVE